MQTSFTPAQLADPEVANSEQILRKCVHCGFCTATCPTYVLLGDELDSPRGRIYLIKNMLEGGRAATADEVKHVDRCLSCLACMTTCPSGVHYQHLVDHARIHIERTYRRPWPERVLRGLLARVIPHPARLRAALFFSRLARPFAALLPARAAAAVRLAPSHVPPAMSQGRQVFPAIGERRARVALLLGCAQSVLTPQVHAASIRVLNRLGAEVVTIAGCCGSVVLHLGDEHGNHGFAARLIRALLAEQSAGGLDAIAVNASGCGTQLKDYGHQFRNDAALAADAATVSRLSKDITEIVASLGLPQLPSRSQTVAYQSPCSMQHGQQLDRLPRELLRQAGYTVKDIPENHLCCGSAGTYNILQPEIAQRLAARKLENIRSTGAQLVATGNVGCSTQLAAAGDIRVLHTIELIDQALAAR